VLYFSTHQYPYYPGTGSVQEIGRGAGQGYTVNVPLRTGPGDAEYLKIFQKILKPVALEFKPDIVMLSAGFDIYFKDPLGGCRSPRRASDVSRGFSWTSQMPAAGDGLSSPSRGVITLRA